MNVFTGLLIPSIDMAREHGIPAWVLSTTGFLFSDISIIFYCCFFNFFTDSG